MIKGIPKTGNARIYVKSELFDTEEFVFLCNGRIDGMDQGGDEPVVSVGRGGNPIIASAAKNKLWTISISGRMKNWMNFIPISRQNGIPVHFQIRYGRNGPDDGTAYAAETVLCIDSCVISSYSLGAVTAMQSEDNGEIVESMTVVSGYVNAIKPGSMFVNALQPAYSVVPIECVTGYAEAQQGARTGASSLVVTERLNSLGDAYTTLLRYYWKVSERIIDNRWRYLHPGIEQLAPDGISRWGMGVFHLHGDKYLVGSSANVSVFDVSNKVGSAAPTQDAVRIADGGVIVNVPGGDSGFTVTDFFVGFARTTEGIFCMKQSGAYLIIGTSGVVVHRGNAGIGSGRTVTAMCSDEKGDIIFAINPTATHSGEIFRLKGDSLLEVQRSRVHKDNSLYGTHPRWYSVNSIACRGNRIVFDRISGTLASPSTSILSAMNDSLYVEYADYPLSTIFGPTVNPFVQAIHMLSENVIFASITKRVGQAEASGPFDTGTNPYTSRNGTVICSLDGGKTWNVELQGYSILGFTETTHGLVAYGTNGRWEELHRLLYGYEHGSDLFTGNGAILGMASEH